MLIKFPHPPGAGGPGSFQSRFESRLVARGDVISYFGDDSRPPDIIFVVGGTRRVLELLRYKVQRVPIIYRLDGILWVHRKVWPGFRKFFSCEIRNVLCKFTHAFLADHVVYQSKFVRDWWTRAGWRQTTSYSIIHNGVDITEFSPRAESLGDDSEGTNVNLICVEGHIDYSPYAIDLLNSLESQLREYRIAIKLYGSFAKQQSEKRLSRNIEYEGTVQRKDVHKVFSSGIFLSLDVNAACPNTVIEALSSGIPVVGLDTGSLSELVPRQCGRVVEYTGNSWKLDKPTTGPLVTAILEISHDYSQFSKNARSYAESNFEIGRITDRYCEVMERIVGCVS